jgi:VanZ family protein
MRRFAALLALLVVLLLIPMPPAGKVINSVGDMLHVPLFACLSFVLFRLVHQRFPRATAGAAAMTWVLSVAVAALTELMQVMTGRTASGHDLFADVCGVTTGVLAAAAVASATRRWRILLIAVAACAMGIAIVRPARVLMDIVRQRTEMPVLGSFERAGETSRWVAKESRLERASVHASAGTWCLKVDLQPGTYPGASLPLVPPDWSAYDELVTDIWLEGPEPLRIIVKVTDRAHNNEHDDRFQRAFLLVPGANTIRVPLVDIETAPRHRLLDLQRVATLSYFATRLPSPRNLYLDNIHLR